MDKNRIKLVAFDLDGTLTQHKTPLSPEHRAVLDALGKKYRLLMVGAGMCSRIFRQMGSYPIDICGSYGMQLALYRPERQDIETVESITLPCDRQGVLARVETLRREHGFTVFAGESVEFHPSGAVTIPLLGTKAAQEDKLAFDPDRKKRRAIYRQVQQLFPEYNVFVGGSSSFDMTPVPYDKAYALKKYCAGLGIAPDEAVFVGDDYGPGGNDEPVYRSDFHFITIDDHREFPKKIKPLL